MEFLNIEIVALCMLFLLLLVKRATQRKRRDETPMADMVKRRRELTMQLNLLTGDRIAASRLVQDEAQRLNASASSIVVLEAAVVRAARERT